MFALKLLIVSIFATNLKNKWFVINGIHNDARMEFLNAINIKRLVCLKWLKVLILLSYRICGKVLWFYCTASYTTLQFEFHEKSKNKVASDPAVQFAITSIFEEITHTKYD